MAFYIKKSNKPLEAMQLTEMNREEVMKWCGGKKGLDGSIILKTPESDGETQVLKTWSYVFRGYTEELGWHFWPVDSSYVKENYDKISD